MAEQVVQDVVENITEAVNSTAKVPASPEGMALAYGSLVFMALVPIFFGSYRSITHQEHSKATGEKIDTLTTHDAAMFPLIASCALFGLYMVFKIFSKDYINMLLTSYFFVLGIMAMSNVFSPVITGLVPSFVPFQRFHLSFTRKKKIDSEESEEDEKLVDYNFSSHDLVCMVLCAVIGVWYIIEKHWVANNMLGLAFAINGIELLTLSSVQTGALLLSGLFIYDIFWVFGTNVMVTVARSFEAPIKLVFPQDLLEHGLSASNFAMLGLGDIVIPGIFIALLLRFDNSLKRGRNTYFNATFFAYFMGLLGTIFVMHVFKHAQPALLYLVPACLGVPTLVSVCKGEFSKFIGYEDVTAEEMAGNDNTVKKTKDKDPNETRTTRLTNTLLALFKGDSSESIRNEDLTEEEKKYVNELSKRVTRADTRKEK